MADNFFADYPVKSGGGGGGGANTTLSNLTAPTAINQDLIFAESPDAIITTNSQTDTTTSSASMNIFTGSLSNAASTGTTGNILIQPGSVQGTVSPGMVTIQGGAVAGGGAPGGIVSISPGTGSVEFDVTPTGIEFVGQTVMDTIIQSTTTFSNISIGAGSFVGAISDNDQTNQLIQFGSSDTAIAGNFPSTVALVGGNNTNAASTADAGSVLVSPGSIQSGTGAGGDLTLRSGSSSGGRAGNIEIQTSSGTGGLQGTVTISALYLGMPRAAADPTGTTGGQVYFNTTTHKLKVFNGTTWETITSA